MKPPTRLSELGLSPVPITALWKEILENSIKKSKIVFLRLNFSNDTSPECSAMEMGQFSICKLKWDLLRTSVTACIIERNTFSTPFGIFYVRTEV